MAVTCCFGGGSALLLAGALLFALDPLQHAFAKKTIPGMTPTYDLPKVSRVNSGICGSKYLSKSLSSLNELRGCRVIEGFVQILLFDNNNEPEFDNIFDNYTFPELEEITDFLLLYRVNGLKSIGQLFPNLRVIRGQEKMFSYSLIVYEMFSLQEIGLYSLTNITSGLIRIDKNPSLCYVNSIDWFRIAHEKGEHFIMNLKAENECPLCPGDDDFLNFTCPISSDKGKNGRRLCWNRSHCQIVCPENCIACDSKGRCCDEKCLGGCSDENPKQCFVCRDFSMDGKCMDSCPIGRYEFLGRRCITREECISAPKPLELVPKIQQPYPYKIFKNKSCVLACPSDYTDDFVKHTCEHCNGTCTKQCPGAMIDSVDAARQLSGCTHINGSLEIQIRGGKNVVSELIENLSTIEEIDGYLKIVRSFPLVSLNFFKRLRYIGGNVLDSQKNSFIVFDNQNLQDIWPWKDRELKIERGRLSFHFNPRLCMNKIEELRQKTKLSPFTNEEVAPNSNGDKIACNVQDLQVSIATVSSKSVEMIWERFKIIDHRKLLGYVVYSIKFPGHNVTFYDGKDACGGDGWRVDDVLADVEKTTVRYLLTKLLPFTKYAFYVKTYTIANVLIGAQSNISYFTTLEDKPTTPEELRAEAKDDETLVISWKRPISSNGNLTHYIITANITDHRLPPIDYCQADYYPEKSSIIETSPKTVTRIVPLKNNTCDCGEVISPMIHRTNETEISNQISFEDKLYNFVYIKGGKEKNKSEETPSSRKKRAHEFPIDRNISGLFTTLYRSNVTNEAAFPGDKRLRVLCVNTTETHLEIKNLLHYSNYFIEVRACRKPYSIHDETFCSDPKPFTVRTEKKPHADVITNLTIHQSNGELTVMWDRPLQPNGHIVAYNIEYHLIDLEVVPIHRCINAINETKLTNISFTFSLQKMNYGNYSLRISARTDAGAGEWSEYVYFYREEPSGGQTVLIVVPVVIIPIIIAMVVYYIYKRQYHSSDDITLIASVNPEYVSTDYEPDDWEVPRDKIKLLKELGQGSFGMVYEGIVKDVKGKHLTKCAIKTVNEHATNRERIEFLNEASVMKAFDTAHVVRLLGVVSQGQPTLVVMELMANGDLKSFLRSHRENTDSDCSRQPPTLKRILQMAIEIADGMAYLSAKKYVHRDLAARNCMVAEDLTVKIGDFGMTRDVYETDYYRKGTKGLLPVRWMAPESLKDGVFTSNSDVWSYGVVLWEMATLASQPYQGLSNEQVLRYVIEGGIMERPKNCPNKLYDLMMYCWRHKPTDRPTFLTLCSRLMEDACEGFSELSFYHSAAGVEVRNSSEHQNQDDPTTPLRGNQIEDNLDNESHVEFLEYPLMTKDISSIVNGYVSNRTSNGTTT